MNSMINCNVIATIVINYNNNIKYIFGLILLEFNLVSLKFCHFFCNIFLFIDNLILLHFELQII